MARCGGLAGAAVVLLLGLTGCTSTDLFRLETQVPEVPAPPDREVNAPLNDVYAHAQAVLHLLNLFWQPSGEGQAIRLACVTPSGAHFSLMLTSWKMGDGSYKTRMHVGWDHDPDPEDGVSDPIAGMLLDMIERATLVDAFMAGNQPATRE